MEPSKRSVFDKSVTYSPLYTEIKDMHDRLVTPNIPINTHITLVFSSSALSIKDNPFLNSGEQKLHSE